jgi:hypothetical protein
MTDAQILLLTERAADAPSLTIGGTRFVLVEAGLGRELLLVWHRKGQGGRWTWAPSSDTFPLHRVPAYYLILRDLKTWLRLTRIDFAGHARAMGARTL